MRQGQRVADRAVHDVVRQLALIEGREGLGMGEEIGQVSISGVPHYSWLQYAQIHIAQIHSLLKYLSG
jgi:hypothetical protein